MQALSRKEASLVEGFGSARHTARSNRDRFPSLANRLLVLVPLPLIFLELVPPVSAPFPVPLFYVECPVTGSATNLSASIVPRIPVLRLPSIYGHTASQVGNLFPLVAYLIHRIIMLPISFSDCTFFMSLLYSLINNLVSFARCATVANPRLVGDQFNRNCSVGVTNPARY